MKSVFLSFFGSGVSREETCFFESGTVSVAVHGAERSCDAVTDCAGLTCYTAALDVDENVKLVFCAGGLKRLIDDKSCRIHGEVFFDSSLVDDDLTFAAGDKANTGDGRFSSARCNILNFFNCFFRCHTLLLNPRF